MFEFKDLKPELSEKVKALVKEIETYEQITVESDGKESTAKKYLRTAAALAVQNRVAEQIKELSPTDLEQFLVWDFHRRAARMLSSFSEDYEKQASQFADRKQEAMNKHSDNLKFQLRETNESLLADLKTEKEEHLRDIAGLSKAVEDAIAQNHSLDVFAASIDRHFRAFRATAMGAGVIAAITAAGFLWFAFFSDSLSGSANWDAATGFKVGAVLLTATIGIWAARILQKIALSERHLMNDAKERAAFTKAYLAKLKEPEGAVTDDQKAIILASIYRPSANGLIKDDGGNIEPSIIAMAAKYLAK